MDQSNLQSLIEEVCKLNPPEQNELIKAIIFHRNNGPLTEKEKQFIDESEQHFKELHDIRSQLSKVLKKLG